MDDLFRIGLSNAVAASVLALIALLVGRIVRRPALMHALWLLVLVKLITPPLRCIEFDWPSMPETAGNIVQDDGTAAVSNSTLDPDSVPITTLEPADLSLAMPAVPEATDALPDIAQPNEQPETRATSVPVSPFVNVSWFTLLGSGWLIGSAAWLALAAGRTLRFHRLLRHAQPAPAQVCAEVQQWARELGLRRCPGVWFVPGRVAPMLWMLGGRPRLYLPSALWAAIDAGQRSAVILHELAHLRRADHWVRALEIVTTCVYWWHPILWLARRELREAEEQCCDAWVVWAMPGAARTYALAVVETLDFLSKAPVALPAVASGVGPTHDLRRRLTMIMQGSTPRRLSWRGVLSVVGVAAVLLPFVPTLAQSQDPGDGGQPGPQEVRSRNQEDRARAEVQRAQEMLERARAQLQEAERRVQEVNQRQAGGRDGGGRRYIVIIQDESGREIRRIDAGQGHVIRVPEGDTPRGGFGGGFGGRGGPGMIPGGGKMGGSGPQHPGMAPPGGPGPGMGGADGGGRAGAGMPGPGGGPMAGGMSGMKMGAPGGADLDRRFQQLERRLDEVTRALEQMRQQLEQRPRSPGQRGPDRPQRENRSQQRGSKEEGEDVIKELKPQPEGTPNRRDPDKRAEPRPADSVRPRAGRSERGDPDKRAEPRPAVPTPPPNTDVPPSPPRPADDRPPQR